MPIVMLVGASIIWGGALWLAASLLQRSPGVSGAARQWIWRGAAMLLVLPFVALPVVTWLGLGLAPSTTIIPAIGALDMLLEAPMPSPEVLQPITPANEAPAVAATAPSLLNVELDDAIIAALLTGWLVRLGLALAARAKLRAMLKPSQPIAGPALAALGAWAMRLGLKQQPKLREVAAGLSPFSFGAIRPVICLPQGMDRELDPRSLDLVIAHECTHVARGDGWLRPVERIVADIFWFNPFAWAMRRELDVARELACDEAVVSATSEHRAYARTLRDVAGYASGLGGSAPAASMSLGAGGRVLMLRMKRALDGAKARPARATLIIAGVLAATAAPLAVAQVVLTTPKPLAPPNEPTAMVAPEPQKPAPKPARDLNAWFPAQVVSVTPNAKRGFNVSLKQTTNTATQVNCDAELWGLPEVFVERGAQLKPGDPIGKIDDGVGHGQQCDKSDGAVLERALYGKIDIFKLRNHTTGIYRPPYPAAEGRRINAWYPARVTVAEADGVGGYRVRLEQERIATGNNRCNASLLHLHSLAVKVGDVVEPGQQIGVGAVQQMSFHLDCPGEMKNRTARFSREFPDLFDQRPTYIEAIGLARSYRGLNAGDVRSPFAGRVTAVEKRGALTSISLEADDAIDLSGGKAIGCKTRIVGLSSVTVSSGQAIAADAMLGRQTAPDGYWIVCEGFTVPPSPGRPDAKPGVKELIPAAFDPRWQTPTPVKKALGVEPDAKPGAGGVGSPQPILHQQTPNPPKSEWDLKVDAADEAHQRAQKLYDSGAISIQALEDSASRLAIAYAERAEADAGGAPGNGHLTAQARLCGANNKLSRSEALYKNGQISRGEIDRLRTERDVLKARLDGWSVDSKGTRVLINGAPQAILTAPARLNADGSYGERVDPQSCRMAWHDGVDIFGATGDSIYSPGDGVVTIAGGMPGYGNVVEVLLPQRAANGQDVRLRFGHLNKLAVVQGAKVKAGQIIGTMGNSSARTDPHLHLEVRLGDRTWDPQLVDGLVLVKK